MIQIYDDKKGTPQSIRASLRVKSPVHGFYAYGYGISRLEAVKALHKQIRSFNDELAKALKSGVKETDFYGNDLPQTLFD